MGDQAPRPHAANQPAAQVLRPTLASPLWKNSHHRRPATLLGLREPPRPVKRQRHATQRCRSTLGRTPHPPMSQHGLHLSVFRRRLQLRQQGLDQANRAVCVTARSRQLRRPLHGVCRHKHRRRRWPRRRNSRRRGRRCHCPRADCYGLRRIRRRLRRTQLRSWERRGGQCRRRPLRSHCRKLHQGREEPACLPRPARAALPR
mmetsp:Transcript_91963/g.264598  ORF Transcript_91963/g.264598 Transcript_91963/m.264598 type:complete len:203 (-) Transcript_91963:596-1204(-)